ncbi:MAG: ppGpp synthetase/RelA/SpoT-type nucleotidyltransferase [Alloalcanivorax sp.]|jgi:ppGpp synthetase/RelA/SpoT-type nucleotidyltranferase
MNEDDFVSLWEKEEPAYRAWGNYVKKKVEDSVLSIKGENFLKFPPEFRVKKVESLIDKAFYRDDKMYDDPYAEIDDKVGVRFIVLLVEDIDFFTSIIEEGNWDCVECRHFKKERDKAPLLFTYQSVHFLLSPKSGVSYGIEGLPDGVTCEVQVRTVLQHAHAELTHDGIYKSKKLVRPDVHRAVAKSIALIETADNFFSEVTEKLNYGPVESSSIASDLDAFYRDKVGYSPVRQKSAILIWDAFEQFLSDGLFIKLMSFVEANQYVLEAIKSRYSSNALYRQGCIFFVFWLVKKRTQRCIKDWPIDKKHLDIVASDLGISLDG